MRISNDHHEPANSGYRWKILSFLSDDREAIDASCFGTIQAKNSFVQIVYERTKVLGQIRLKFGVTELGLGLDKEVIFG